MTARKRMKSKNGERTAAGNYRMRAVSIKEAMKWEKSQLERSGKEKSNTLLGVAGRRKRRQPVIYFLASRKKNEVYFIL